MVGRVILVHEVGVRLPVPQPYYRLTGFSIFLLPIKVLLKRVAFGATLFFSTEELYALWTYLNHNTAIATNTICP